MVYTDVVMTEVTDEAIARQVQRGDVESFGLLMERYKAKISRYAKKFLFGREDVEDLVQEVFIKAYINIQSFDARRRFSPWLYRIAHNTFINAMRKHQRARITFLDLDTLFPHPVARETADRGALDGDLAQLLDRYLGRLPPKYREPLVLYFYQELGYQEIADLLQIPVSTVGVRIARAKAMLKKNIAPNDQLYG